eukprot:gb/GECH01010895.1/.p1 GENE.gb/GECH01010895.1/~~gb/GECH01010895.1/.p1  ORF type:complete len:500 (+),score=131.78 gb/GECH01010895.1/:1-1500(+)
MNIFNFLMNRHSNSHSRYHHNSSRLMITIWVHIAILSLLLFSIFNVQAVDQCFTNGYCYECDTEKCSSSECRCATTETPGGLDVSEIPQFVLLTFDDAVTVTEYPKAQEVLSKAQNPNGCSAKGTFYVSTKYNDYWLAQRMYAENNEIGIHTMTHETGLDSSAKRFREEILGARRALSLFSRIPSQEMTGFRAPFLAINEDALSTLHDEGFEYDASVPEIVKSGLSPSMKEQIWPYTYDNGVGQTCPTGSCNVELDGLWEVPIWALHDPDTEEVVSSMDPINPNYDKAELFKGNFDAKRNGNKSPFGVFIHTAWLSDESNRKDLFEFIEYASSFDDVWFVTAQQLLEWVRNPIPLSQMKNHELFEKKCHNRYEHEEDVCDGLNEDKEMAQWCSYRNGQFNFYTCAPRCPELYPDLGTLDIDADPPRVCGNMVCLDVNTTDYDSDVEGDLDNSNGSDGTDNSGNDGSGNGENGAGSMFAHGASILMTLVIMSLKQEFQNN